MSNRFDERTLRKAMGSFPTGVCVLSANRTDGQAIGMTVNSFSSVSLDPPLVLVCLGMVSPRTKQIIEAEKFSISVLNDDQTSVSNHFAQPGEGLAEPLLMKVGTTGVPYVPKSTAVFECKLEGVHEAGDHFIVVGRVMSFESNFKARPLLYFRGDYRGLDQGQDS